MDKQSRTYQAYVQILKEELIPAMGCTEPIAIAYAAAKARDVLGGMPDKVEIGVSSNIIKNVKSVIVPNTDGMKGIEAAAAAGLAARAAGTALSLPQKAAPKARKLEDLTVALVESRYRPKLAMGRRDLVVAALQRRGFAYAVVKEAIKRVEEE